MAALCGLIAACQVTIDGAHDDPPLAYVITGSREAGLRPPRAGNSKAERSFRPSQGLPSALRRHVWACQRLGVR